MTMFLMCVCVVYGLFNIMQSIAYRSLKREYDISQL